MNLNFTIKEIEEVNRVLKIKAIEANSVYIWKLISPDISKPLVLSIYCDIHNAEDNDVVVSVQTQHGYYELHNISTFMTFEPDEVIFTSRYDERLSCLIIGANGSCSLFANIAKEILNADLTTLAPAKLLAAMQLGVVDSSFQS